MPGFNRTAKGSNDRNRGGCRLEIEDEVIANGNNHIRITTHDVAGQFRIVLGTPFAGISLNQYVLPLDVSQAAEFGENRTNGWREARLGECGDWVRGMNDGDAVNFSALLRMGGAHRGDDH